MSRGKGMNYMKTFWKIIMIGIFCGLMLVFCRCSFTNQVKEENQIVKPTVDTKLLKVEDFFVEYSKEKPERVILTHTDSDGNTLEYIAYTQKEHDKIVLRLEESKQNLEAGKLLVQKYNIQTETVIQLCDLYVLAQEQSWNYEQLWNETQKVLERERLWNKIEDGMTKATLIIAIVAVIALAI